MWGLYLFEERDLPKLSHEETTQLFRQMREGDENARDRLIIGHLKYVKWIGRKWINSEVYEDLLSCGVMGLMKAIDSFDPEKGFMFTTYSYLFIEGYMKSELKKFMRQTGTGLKKKIGWERHRPIEFYELVLSDDGELIEKIFENSGKLEEYSYLTKAERKYLSMRFGFGSAEGKPMTLEEIVNECGVSRQAVAQAINRAIKKIRSRNEHALL